MKTKITLIAIIILAAFFRLYNVNWDSNHHLHPDERFLVMVGNDMKPPATLPDYMNPQTSTFNPANIGHNFYVYGVFPVVLNKLAALKFNNDNYNAFVLQGRVLSAFFDLLTLLVVTKLLMLLRKHRNLPRETIWLGTFFYAIAVLPIQLSHFFAVDTFLNFFIMASLYYMLKYYYEQQWRSLLWSGILLGFAFASKISAMYVLPLLLVLLIMLCLKKEPLLTHQIKLALKNKSVQLAASLLFASLLFFIPMYLTLRIADPYYFADTNIFNPQANPLFLQNMEALKSWSKISEWVLPPSVQWINKTPILFPLYNIAFWGVGLFYFLFICVGIFFFIKKHRHPELIIIFSWVLLFFLYQSTQVTKTMRYFIFLYPFFAILAGFGFHYLLERYNRTVKGFFIGLALLYPFAFLSIYIMPMSRIAATEWIVQNVPVGSTVLNEHWDDALPLHATGYDLQLLPVFDPDTPEKWTKMNGMLQSGDYLILSSNRGWGSITTVPERYPQMNLFYTNLFSGKSQYKKVKEFTSYPSFEYMGIPFRLPDDLAEESFTVYDHPKVMIFKNTAK